jgi:hypothetical protein
MGFACDQANDEIHESYPKVWHHLVVMASRHSWSAIPKVSQPKGRQANGLFRVFPNPNINA